MEHDPPLVASYQRRMLSKWLRDALKSAGMTQSELARQMTVALGRSIDRAAVQKMTKDKGGRKISADELFAIAKILGAPAPAEKSDLRTVTVATHVQAGLWAETWEWADDDHYQVAVPRDAALDGFRLYGAETRGPSMNKRWPERTVVVFTNVDETLESPQPGKRYVVEAKRADGKREHTVKLLHRDEQGKFWLVPESNDPLFQAPLSVDDGATNGDEVRIVGRVRYSVARE